ncbi:hypothetical protein RFI_10715 [Reticulomyxa filosa]|uniref:Uncharacterized protein n=1 Tax=Reticulomyxa filosa TaxID=46433 RepID=X6NL51_RETFI|nr:hypothetical protein RFI_10715 [Reticulomyxa filosa]|eukprot:ETO26424.1 hypothetical protein RFI_10715 [Reticulomyxa filosa]
MIVFQFTKLSMVPAFASNGLSHTLMNSTKCKDNNKTYAFLHTVRTSQSKQYGRPNETKKTKKERKKSAKFNQVFAEIRGFHSNHLKIRSDGNKQQETKKQNKQKKDSKKQTQKSMVIDPYKHKPNTHVLFIPQYTIFFSFDFHNV